MMIPVKVYSMSSGNKAYWIEYHAYSAMPSETDSDKPAAPSTDVDRVIDQLDKRLVSDVDRGRLHKSLDKADKPPTGRDGADEALGRAIKGA